MIGISSERVIDFIGILTIGLKRDIVAGQERVVWNPAISLPAEEFEFTAAETARIRAAVEACDSYSASSDRRWLEPLVSTLFDSQVA